MEMFYYNLFNKFRPKTRYNVMQFKPYLFYGFLKVDISINLLNN